MAGLPALSLSSEGMEVRERAKPKSASFMKQSEFRRMLLGYTECWGNGDEFTLLLLIEE